MSISSWYNPSLVVHGDRLVSSIKLTLIEKRGEKSWWINSVFICQGPSNKDLTGLSCQPYDPWTLPLAIDASSSKKTTPPSPYEECEFTSQVRKGKTDVEGLGDVKVWRWPGRGVFAIFGRKPRRKGTDRYCRDVIVYHQFLAQVDNSSSSLAAADSGGGAAVKDGASLQSDEWDQLFSSRVLSPLPTGLRLGRPLPLLPPLNHSYSHQHPFTMEKNWMPFIYNGDLDATGKAQDRLFVVYSIIPHLVFELLPIIGRGGGQEDGIESVERYRNLRHKPRDRKANKDIMSKFRSVTCPPICYLFRLPLLVYLPFIFISLSLNLLYLSLSHTPQELRRTWRTPDDPHPCRTLHVWISLLCRNHAPH